MAQVGQSLLIGGFLPRQNHVDFLITYPRYKFMFFVVRIVEPIFYGQTKQLSPFAVKKATRRKPQDRIP